MDSARWDIQGELYEDARFSAQQAAELATKTEGQQVVFKIVDTPKGRQAEDVRPL